MMVTGIMTTFLRVGWWAGQTARLVNSIYAMTVCVLVI